MNDLSQEQQLQDTLALAATGDAMAWRALIDAYSPRVFGLLFKQCRDRDLAEELTQASFVKVVTRLSDYSEQGRFEAWLFRIAMNHLRDEMRRRKRQATPMGGLLSDSDSGDAPSNGETLNAIHGRIRARGNQAQRYVTGEEDPGQQVSRREELDQLREVVATLKPEDQEILYLRHTAGLTFAQIAESLGKPLGTVLARGHRALAKVREKLAAKEPA